MHFLPYIPSMPKQVDMKSKIGNLLEIILSGSRLRITWENRETNQSSLYYRNDKKTNQYEPMPASKLVVQC